MMNITHRESLDSLPLTGLRWMICHGTGINRKIISAFSNREDCFRSYPELAGWYGVHLDVIDATTGKSEWGE